MAQKPAGFVPDGFEPDSPVPGHVPGPRDEHGMPVVSSATDDEPASPLLEMLGPLAHPQTLTDFARLLTLPVDSVRKAAISAAAMAAARKPAGAALTGAGRGMEKAGGALERPSRYVGTYEAMSNPKRAVATLATPPALKVVGRGLQKLGAMVSGETPQFSVAEEAALKAQGFTPEVMAKMRPAIRPPATGVASAPVASEAAPMSAAPAVMAEAAPVVKPSILSEAVKAKLSAAETGEYLRLRALGKSDEAAKTALEAARDFAKRFGLPTGETVRKAVVDRNASGRWPE